MNRASPRAQHLAQQLLAHKAAAQPRSGSSFAALSRVFEELRQPLSALAGANGFQVLLARAVKLAKDQVPSLSAVHLAQDGVLEGIEDVESKYGPEAGTVLLAQLIGLLIAFVGESLVMNIFIDIWPDLSVTETASGENQNEING